ncbi:putative dual specificity protein phosphatase DSP8 [Diplonema papillatum]|nr:putative dual specificity protein phosphatase DSP8 [Diplonema papillatum]
MTPFWKPATGGRTTLVHGELRGAAAEWGGRALSAVGLVAVCALPVQVGLLATGHRQAAALSLAPVLICLLLGKVFITIQKAGLRKGGTLTWCVARLTLWPTVAFNATRNLIKERKYYDEVSPGIIVGGAPWASMAEELIQKHNVRYVINCCEEYVGPEDVYERHEVAHIRLNCIDFCDVPLEKIVAAVDFMERKSPSSDAAVYVHCKAGKGRAVTVATAYLAKHRFNGDARAANEAVKKARPTAIGTVYQRPMVREFASRYCNPAAQPPQPRSAA